MWHAAVYRAWRTLDQTLRDGVACQQPAWCVPAILAILEETVLLKRCVCICQAGRTSALAHLLITIYLSCWCPFTELHAWWFQQSKVITTSPVSAVMPNGLSACQQDHSYPRHFLSVGAAVNSSNSLVILGQASPPVSPPVSPAGLLSSLWMSLTAWGRGHARLGLEVLLRGHSAKAKWSETPPKQPVVATCQLCRVCLLRLF